MESPRKSGSRRHMPEDCGSLDSSPAVTNVDGELGVLFPGARHERKAPPTRGGASFPGRVRGSGQPRCRKVVLSVAGKEVP
jgi:hypothetical protein